ncbi:hypothetical protein XENOCAPTIV_018100 [Xenoophorus captivus]|uniref:Uncharacterized protein n=1 Tax=Xenoophorus captivus TaxID=1517983 RepID=A0ABV0SH45_9TELE
MIERQPWIQFEEFMSVCQQRDISALYLPCPDDHQCGRDRTIGKGVLLYSQWHHGKSAATPPFPNVGSRLNAIYFESSRKVCGWSELGGEDMAPGGRDKLPGAVYVDVQLGIDRLF